jgi:hypothetical protein
MSSWSKGDSIIALNEIFRVSVRGICIDISASMLKEQKYVLGLGIVGAATVVRTVCFPEPIHERDASSTGQSKYGSINNLSSLTRLKELVIIRVG